jgi:hypothetical protein
VFIIRCKDFVAFPEIQPSYDPAQAVRCAVRDHQFAGVTTESWRNAAASVGESTAHRFIAIKRTRQLGADTARVHV